MVISVFQFREAKIVLVAILMAVGFCGGGV
jgi:hypothetical protein